MWMCNVQHRKSNCISINGQCMILELTHFTVVMIRHMCTSHVSCYSRTIQMCVHSRVLAFWLQYWSSLLLHLKMWCLIWIQSIQLYSYLIYAHLILLLKKISKFQIIQCTLIEMFCFGVHTVESMKWLRVLRVKVGPVRS